LQLIEFNFMCTAIFLLLISTSVSSTSLLHLWWEKASHLVNGHALREVKKHQK